MIYNTELPQNRTFVSLATSEKLIVRFSVGTVRLTNLGIKRIHSRFTSCFILECVYCYCGYCNTGYCYCYFRWSCCSSVNIWWCSPFSGEHNRRMDGTLHQTIGPSNHRAIMKPIFLGVGRPISRTGKQIWKQCELLPFSLWKKKKRLRATFPFKKAGSPCQVFHVTVAAAVTVLKVKG